MKASSPIAILRRYANSASVRVQPCNVCDANVGEWARLCVEFKRAGRRIELHASKSLLRLEVGVETTFACSINRPDRISLMNEPLSEPPGLPRTLVFENPAFRKLPGQADLRDWLSQPENRAAVDSLNLSQRESVHIYGNSLVFIFEPPRSIDAALADILALAERLPKDDARVPCGCFEIDNLILDPSKLPEDLRLLVPHIRAWAIGDDVRREEKLRTAEREQKSRLLRDVSPYLDCINAYLDSFGDETLPDEAILLGNLAEAVSEITE
jgi:hypothetical protein